ncbi:MAG: hypothetical protein Q7V05_15795 [Methanoregula sp.]|nr:hypothetical protein [Methanoregula sp.]
MADITIPSDLLGQFVGILLFETSLIIGLLIQDRARSHENQYFLTSSQQLEGWKIASGFVACVIHDFRVNVTNAHPKCNNIKCYKHNT